MRSIREKKSWVNAYEEAKSFVEDLEVIYDFFKEDEATSENVSDRYNIALNAIEKLEFKNMFI
jgi:peptide chain release factor 2